MANLGHSQGREEGRVKGRESTSDGLLSPPAALWTHVRTAIRPEQFCEHDSGYAGEHEIESRRKRTKTVVNKC